MTLLILKALVVPPLFPLYLYRCLLGTSCWFPPICLCVPMLWNHDVMGEEHSASKPQGLAQYPVHNNIVLSLF